MLAMFSLYGWPTLGPCLNWPNVTPMSEIIVEPKMLDSTFAQCSIVLAKYWFNVLTYMSQIAFDFITEVGFRGEKNHQIKFVLWFKSLE